MELIKTNQRELFNTFNKLFDKNKNNRLLPSHNNKVDLVNDFNHAFLNKISDIRAALPPSTLPASHFYTSSCPSSNSASFELSSFEPTTPEEILSIIKQHGVKTSSNDPLPGFLVKENLEILLPHF